MRSMTSSCRAVADRNRAMDGSSPDASPLGHDRDESLVLDSLAERGRGTGVSYAAEPDEPVGPVQQVGVTP
jgi:hypothetical protein